jgi:hypothetical protein
MKSFRNGILHSGKHVNKESEFGFILFAHDYLLTYAGDGTQGLVHARLVLYY